MMRLPGVDDPQELKRRLALVARVVELRRNGRIEPIWIDAWEVHLRRDPFDYEGSKHRITWDELASMVEAAEGTMRKPVGREELPPAVREIAV
jgi:hypothetical protein